MTFYYSSWLWILPLAPLFLILRLWSVSKSQERFRRFAAEKAWPQIAPELDWGARRRRAIAWSAALLFLLLALARPQWGLKEEVIHVTGLDIIVALDVSNSMDTEDVIPNRMKKAHHIVHSLIDRLGSDRVGIVAFAASTYLACPLTTDHGYVDEILEGLSPKSVLNQGTDIGLALETSVDALDRGAEQGDKDGTRVVVLVTDGEDLEDAALEGAKKVEKSGAKLYILGIGSEKGGPIPIRDESGALLAYKKDAHGQPIVSRMNPSALEKIAEAAHGKYFSATQNENELENVLHDISSLGRSDKLEKRRITLEERFQIPLGIALLILLLEMGISLRKKSVRTAVSVGTGVTALVLLCCVTAPSAYAKDSVEVYLENKKGLESFQKGNIDDAREHFGRAQAIDPKKPELLFNQGTIQLDQKSYDQAAEGFSGAAKEATGAKNPALAGRAFYNLGSTQAAKGDTDTAIRTYLDGIDAAKAAKDPELENDLRKKIELLVQNEQQKQKNQQNKDQKNQDKSDQKDQQSKSDKDKSESESGGKPDQKNQGSQAKDEKNSQGKKPFESQKLSKEDAERVMNELSDREKELQAKMTKQKGRPEKRDRDW